MKKKLIIMSAIVICLITTLFILVTPFPRSGDIVIYDTVEKQMEHYDYIFVAKVDKKMGCKQDVFASDNTPFTFYSVEPIHYLKGSSDHNNIIASHGGKNLFGIPFISPENSKELVVGDIYLFYTNKTNGNKTIIDKDSLMIYNNTQKIKLENYDLNKSAMEQNDEINSLLSKYM